VRLTGLGPPGEVFHRFLTPKWAHLPTSGAGSASDGGRFNRPGVEALYLSRAPQTALEEYRQGASITPPATLVAYTVKLDPVVDLSKGFDPLVWDAKWAGWDCQWRKIARIDHRTPPCWLLSDIAVTSGYKGILFPSLQHAGGTNLVVFSANVQVGDIIEVHDPEGRLPKDQSSWT
jgi:RES domain-containing protein